MENTNAYWAEAQFKLELYITGKKNVHSVIGSYLSLYQYPLEWVL